MKRLNNPHGFLDRLYLVESSALKLNSLQQSCVDAMKKNIQFEERTKCLCGGTSFIEICSRDRYALDFSIIMCEGCGLLLTTPYLADVTIVEYYDKYYHQILTKRTDYEEKESFFVRNQGQLVFDRVNSFLEDGSLDILEIGFGAGNVLLDFKVAWESKSKHKCKMFGTEFSERLCNKVLPLGIKALQGGVAEAAQFDRKFDLIILSHVLEHVNDISNFIAKLKELSHKDTIFYIEVPGILDLHNKSEYQMDLIKYFIHCHLYHFNFATLTHYMAKEGLLCLDGNEIAYGVFMNGKPDAISLEGNAEFTKSYLISEEYMRKDLHLYASKNKQLEYEGQRMKQELQTERKNSAKFENNICEATKALEDFRNKKISA